MYLSTRDAIKELSLHQNRDSVLRWFRELQFYGFTAMVSPAHHGLNGHGKAPHWRLTEESYLGKAPTKDFLKWDGELFHEQKSPEHYQRKNRSRGTDVRTTPVRTGVPVAAKSKPEMPESGTDVRTITSLTTPCTDTKPITAYHAAPAIPLVPAASAVPGEPSGFVRPWVTLAMAGLPVSDYWAWAWLSSLEPNCRELA